MPLNYRDTSIAYISCMVYFCNKVDKLSYRKQFETTLSCIDKNSKIPDDELLTDDLRCQLICTIGDFLSEPTENTVGQCSGLLFDQGASQGIKIGVLSVNQYVRIFHSQVSYRKIPN